MNLEQIRLSLRDNLDSKYGARERGLMLSRKTIRLCANAIRAIHRGAAEQSSDLLDEAHKLLDEGAAAMSGHPDVRHAGFYHDAAKEYAEGRLTHAMVFSKGLPAPDEIGVEPAAYLNGLGEALGEIRRHILDLLRRGEIGRSEELMETMDEIYHLLSTMDYPDGMTAGLRRTTDVARSIIERTRSDLSTTIIQQNLRMALEDLKPDPV